MFVKAALKLDFQLPIFQIGFCKQFRTLRPGVGRKTRSASYTFVNFAFAFDGLLLDDTVLHLTKC